MGRNISETESPYGHETGDQRRELENLRDRLSKNPIESLVVEANTDVQAVLNDEQVAEEIAA